MYRQAQPTVYSKIFGQLYVFVGNFSLTFGIRVNYSSILSLAD